MTKSLKLEIEDLEERIAPGIMLVTGLNSAAGAHDVPASDTAGNAAAGGAATAFGNVTEHTLAPLKNLSVAIGPC